MPKEPVDPPMLLEIAKLGTEFHDLFEKFSKVVGAMEKEAAKNLEINGVLKAKGLIERAIKQALRLEGVFNVLARDIADASELHAKGRKK